MIVGGYDYMEPQYRRICEQYGCKAKMFSWMKGELKRKIGSPDLIVLFTGTVSHKMARCARDSAKHCHAAFEQCHCSSLQSLRRILEQHCACADGGEADGKSA
ncbi:MULTISPECIES: DUF2325 domain-containing protein [Caproicibacterium]|uniref:DUF2325 domain-containing protein n=1 Tax=Caproicibacterium TaxID=2834348 RepID=UPI003899477D